MYQQACRLIREGQESLGALGEAQIARLVASMLAAGCCAALVQWADIGLPRRLRHVLDGAYKDWRAYARQRVGACGGAVAVGEVAAARRDGVDSTPTPPRETEVVLVCGRPGGCMSVSVLPLLLLSVRWVCLWVVRMHVRKCTCIVACAPPHAHARARTHTHTQTTHARSDARARARPQARRHRRAHPLSHRYCAYVSKRSQPPGVSSPTTQSSQHPRGGTRRRRPRPATPSRMPPPLISTSFPVRASRCRAAEAARMILMILSHGLARRCCPLLSLGTRSLCIYLNVYLVFIYIYVTLPSVGVHVCLYCMCYRRPLHVCVCG